MGRNFMSGLTWIPGIITECEGATVVKLRLDDGRIWRRHLDDVVACKLPEEQRGLAPSTLSYKNDPLSAPAEDHRTGGNEPTVSEQQPHPEQGQEQVEEPRPQNTEPEGLRWSTRVRHPPDWFQ